MLSDRIGDLLKRARQQFDLSREETARRAGVSTRLVAELERGQRPNVSLESALKLLRVVGVTVTANAPMDAEAEVAVQSVDALARAARAARRRQTWTGRRIALHEEGADPPPARSKSKRLASVALVSKQAYGIALAKRRPAAGRPVKKRSSR